MRISSKNKKAENHKEQCLATLKRLERSDDNELERILRLEKAVDSEQLKLAVETEEERKARLENVAATKRLRLAMETEMKENQYWRRGSNRIAHVSPD